MIVVCTNCNARFRLPDEKVGPKGVRIRCSKCHGIFKVRRPVAADEPRPPPPPQSSFEVDLVESGRARGEVPVVSPPAPPDPFVMADQAPVTAAAVDPFAAAMGQVAPPAQSIHDDPFAPPPPTSMGDSQAGRTLLLSSPAPPEPLPLDDPFANASQSPRNMEEPPPPFPDIGFSEAPISVAPPELPPPLPKREPEFAAAAPPQPPSPAPGPAPAMEPPAAAPSIPSGPSPAAEAFAIEVAEQPTPVRSSTRLHALVVNSMSVAVLLALALGLVMYWRGEGRGPRFLQASGIGGQEEVGLAPTQVSSGLYRTFDGRLLLFVRGSIRVASPSAPGRIRVRADLLQGEKVIATSEGPAGAVPGPEELAAISGPQDAERLRGLLEQRATPQARVGDQLPFLVLFTEYPSDIGSIRFRVTAEAAVTAAAN